MAPHTANGVLTEVPADVPARTKPAHPIADQPCVASTAHEDDERQQQTRYWQEHTPANPSLETMMLDSSARKIDELERPEVLGLLGSVRGARVLELGAGIGRFTGELCRAGAAHVHAVDFMAASIAENQRLHSHLYPDQLTFAVEDATVLQCPPGSYDVIFTNWLLMYLSDSEVEDLAARMLTWLTPGGVLFFRESCFKQSGDKPRKDNPTHYRNPREYFRVFDTARQLVDGSNSSSTVAPGPGLSRGPGAAECGGEEGDSNAHPPAGAPVSSSASPSSSSPAGPLPDNSSNSSPAVFAYELQFSKCVDAYVELKHNQNQICWKWRKVAVAPGDLGPHTLRHFLDAAQYSPAGLRQYEAVYGRGFISVGGEAAARSLVPLLHLSAGDRVLDVGCGVGGAAELMSREYGALVHGLDLSVNCLLTCLERASLHECAVGYEVADVTTRDFAPASFTAVHCRDMLLHVPDKQALLHHFARWLTPGGRLLLTDYGTGPGYSPEAEAKLAPGLSAYTLARRYVLWTGGQYEAALQAAGFTNIRLEDRTHELVAHLQRELARLTEGRAGFVAAHGAAAYDRCADSWRGKLERAQGGVQRWWVVTATTPLGSTPGEGTPTTQ